VVDVQVDRGGLDAALTERVDADPTRGELFTDRLVGEDHGPEQVSRPCRANPAEIAGGALVNLATLMLGLMVVGSEALTIHEAAATTGWSARMLRYIEESGLVAPGRSPSGYRLYGPAELQRLRTLRELLAVFGIELSEVGFALRLRDEGRLREAVDAWLSSEAVRPAEVPAGEWLRFEQEKHTQLLAAAAGSSKENL
jgi:DNA-binding transcriptional MerR regulator